MRLVKQRTGVTELAYSYVPTHLPPWLSRAVLWAGVVGGASLGNAETAGGGERATEI